MAWSAVEMAASSEKGVGDPGLDLSQIWVREGKCKSKDVAGWVCTASRQNMQSKLLSGTFYFVIIFLVLRYCSVCISQ